MKSSLPVTLVLVALGLAACITASADWQISIIEANAGNWSSIAVNGRGNPCVAYLAPGSVTPMAVFAEWDGSAWQRAEVGASEYGSGGTSRSLVLDSQGNPCVAYYSPFGSWLDAMYSKRVGGVWQTSRVDQVGTTGIKPSLALNPSGVPYMSYAASGSRLMVYMAYLSGAAWTIVPVETASGTSDLSSIAVDSGGTPHVVYRNSEKVWYGRWNGTGWDKSEVGSGHPFGQAICLGPGGNPNIAYWDYWANALKFARKNGSSWDVETVESIGSLGGYCNMALDKSGRPHISYQDYTKGQLKHAAWNGSSWVISVVDTGANVGETNSIALDADGNPHISYWHKETLTLKYARWEPIPEPSSLLALSGGLAALAGMIRRRCVYRRAFWPARP